MQRASSGAFTNPHQVRNLLRTVFWEGRMPDAPPGSPPSEEKMAENLERARELAAALGEARTAPQDPDEVESPE